MNLPSPDLPFDELSERAQHLIQSNIDRLGQQRQQLYKTLRQRREIFVGQARETSLTQAYTLGTWALRNGSFVLRTCTSILPVPSSLLEIPNTQCKTFAQLLEQRTADLHKPAIEEYDTLNVKKVNASLSELDAYELLKIRSYETQNKNRVTVLREIEKRLA